MTTWSRDQTNTLISLYEENRHLYDIKHELYTNRIAKQATLEKIAEILNEQRHNTTPKDVLTKIKTLRTQYTLEKQKIRQKRNEKGCDGVYVSSLWCFDKLHFLDRYTKIREREVKSNIENEENGISNSSFEYVNTENTVKEIQRNPTKILGTELDDLEQDDFSEISLTKKLSGEICKKKGSNHSFAKFIKDELDSIDDQNTLDDLKWQIQVAVRQAKVKLRQQKTSTCSTSSPILHTAPMTFNSTSDSTVVKEEYYTTNKMC